MPRKLTPQKRADLMRAAIKVFSSRGFQDASVKDIVAVAGASTSTFYRYFRSKDALYEEIVLSFIAGFIDVWRQVYESLMQKGLSAEETLDRMADAFRAVLDYYRRNRDVAKVVFRRVLPIDERFGKQGDMIVDATLEQLSEVLRKARKKGIAARIEPEVGAAIAIGGVFGVAIECVVEGNRDDTGKITGEIMEILRRGIAP